MSATTAKHSAPVQPTASTGQPPGLYLLFIVEMWERFSYYGMRALLVLYLVREMQHPTNPGFGWTRERTYGLYGWYTGLVYLLPLLGGYLADKFLGTHRSMVIGAILISLGHIVLGLSGLPFLEEAGHAVVVSSFIGGLALIVVGTGYFKPCVSVMVGQLYGANDPRRDGAFTIFYMGINLGAFIAPIVCGYLGEVIGWHWGFGAAAVGMIAGLITYLIGRPAFLHDVGLPPPNCSNHMPLFFTLALAAAVGFTALYHYADQLPVFAWAGKLWTTPLIEHETFTLLVSTVVMWSVVIAVLAFAVWFVAIQQPGEKGPVASIFIFMSFNVFFWVAFEQAGSTLNIFAERQTDRWIGSWWEMPASWFQAVNPFIIIVLAPVFALLWTNLGRRRMDPVQPVKIGLGLVLLSGGFVFMVIAGVLSKDGAKVGMIWLAAAYMIQTLGELCLSPTGLSYVTKAAPIRFVSLLMGIWFISSFLAGVLSGKLAQFSEAIAEGRTDLPWYPWFRLGGLGDFFLMLVLIAGGAGILILLLTPFLKMLMPRDNT